MERKVTRPQVRKLLLQHGEVELSIFAKGKDPNHDFTSPMLVTIKDMSELDGRVKKAFKEYSGHSQFEMAVYEMEWYFEHSELDCPNCSKKETTPLNFYIGEDDSHKYECSNKCGYLKIETIEEMLGHVM